MSDTPSTPVEKLAYAMCASEVRSKMPPTLEEHFDNMNAIPKIWRRHLHEAQALLEELCRMDVSLTEKTIKGSRIKHAAVRLENIVYVGVQHAVALLHMKEDCGIDSALSAEYGFVTDLGEWVDRKQAYHIAKAANQIVKKHGNPDVEVLYSEDMFERNEEGASSK